MVRVIEDSLYLYDRKEDTVCRGFEPSYKEWLETIANTIRHTMEI